MKNYVQDGERITYTNGGATTISGGTVVVIGNLLGVACGDITAGATGECATCGVYTVPKVSGAVIAQGESLTWDVSAGAFDDNAATPATGDITGAAAVAWEAKGSSTTTIKVRFTGAPGTKT